jgi:hypothetical protein
MKFTTDTTAFTTLLVDDAPKFYVKFSNQTWSPVCCLPPPPFNVAQGSSSSVTVSHTQKQIFPCCAMQSFKTV